MTLWRSKQMKRILLLLIFLSGMVHAAAKANLDRQTAIDTARLEQQIHLQINRERQNHGLAALQRDAQLAKIARDHSQDMARNQFFSHFNLRGEDPSARGERQGWNKQKQIGPETWASGVAENIYLTHFYDKVYTATRNGVTVSKKYGWKSPEQIVAIIVQGWMQSPGHRKNILSPQYDRQGIGVAISGNAIYITEDMF